LWRNKDTLQSMHIDETTCVLIHLLFTNTLIQIIETSFYILGPTSFYTHTEKIF